MDPGIIPDRKICTEGVKDAPEVVRNQRGRSTTAEVDRIDGLKGVAIRRPQGDLRDQMIGETLPLLRPAGQDREVAVGTDGGAERDVEVEAGIEGNIQWPHFSFARSLARTSSAGIRVALPSSISRQRRWISS